MITVALDKANRVVLPKAVRNEMRLRAGDLLELEISDGQIVLRPCRAFAGMRKKQGVWVFSVRGLISAKAADEALQRIRRERELSFLGDLAPTPPREKKRY